MGPKGVFDRETPSLCTSCAGEDRGTRLGGRSVKQGPITWPANDLATKIDPTQKYFLGREFLPTSFPYFCFLHSEMAYITQRLRGIYYKWC